MITLYDVMDVRDNRIYSVVKVNPKKVKWFVPIEEEP